LFDKKVGILRGWSYGEEFDTATFKKLIEAEEVATDEQNFLKLLRGRIDCILVVKEVAELILEDNSEFTGRVKVVKEPLIVNPTYLIFSKNSNKKELLDEFNKKLLELKENKVYLRLVKKGMIN
jgi:polar amino acid transport system substrate-binding protein